MGGLAEGLGRVLEALGASWGVFWTHFWVLAFEMVFKSALGDSWVRFWLDFEGFGRHLGSILEGLGTCQALF